MGTVSINFASWSVAWHGLWKKLAPPCGYRECTQRQRAWRRLRRTPVGIRLEGARYCVPECLDRALTEALRRLRSFRGSTAKATHRIPLGLLLLSRQLLSAEQLRAALEAQREAGCGQLGDWLQRLGFVNEQQVTAALARQWSCPVWRTSGARLVLSPIPEIPARLLQSCYMLPVNYVESTATLHVAFSGGIDYTVLYAIERMLGCRTEPCLVTPSALRTGLLELGEQHAPAEVVFDRVADADEFARIVRGYAVKAGASEVRMAHCGRYVWVRLERTSRPAISLLLSAPA